MYTFGYNDGVYLRDEGNEGNEGNGVGSKMGACWVVINIFKYSFKNKSGENY